MNPTPILQAPLAIQIHLITVIPAAIIGAWLILASRKGAVPHKTWGKIYMGLMVVTAIAALFIHESNPNGFLGLSFIHLFVPLTLFGMAGALVAIKQKDIKGHRSAVVGTYIGGILVAGGLAFLPGRIMHKVMFG